MRQMRFGRERMSMDLSGSCHHLRLTTPGNTHRIFINQENPGVAIQWRTPVILK